MTTSVEMKKAQRMNILGIVAKHTTTDMRTLAEEAGIGYSTMTMIVRDMTAEKLLEVRGSGRNRRIVAVAPNGYAMLHGSTKVDMADVPRGDHSDVPTLKVKSHIANAPVATPRMANAEPKSPEIARLENEAVEYAQKRATEELRLRDAVDKAMAITKTPEPEHKEVKADVNRIMEAIGTLKGVSVGDWALDQALENLIGRMSERVAENIAPCPFCHGVAEPMKVEAKNGRASTAIACTCCGMVVSLKTNPFDMCAVIKAWNNRN